ncbi:emp24/gp25L/p24 family/GOLD-domain-containing protein [Protomyces lactucae-debilis]|uniref:Emp24/gp25L/p24 family/GOLD-domain-containing protein n=1 Tax=Protomyces lactucae-debilis TaxID=2754530 RepID=A0A1Y2FIJ9_PROLT|nr:emp24/gp25L/p24 family/GOLD-domain-containing protein [Protomyces lactucae-debilis]ORY83771.1 emp24/gp25L/p24 family/GOLD-domain-containing protein [Protomyces lactucae-debilis]
MRSLLLSLLSLVSLSTALKFDLEAQPAGYNRPRCIKDYVGADTMVVVTAHLSGTQGDGQKVDITITDLHGNQYNKPRNVAGESRSAFTVHQDTHILVCFYNELQSNGQQGAVRHVELDVDIGADAMDWAAIQKAEKLQPLEGDLRRAEETLSHIVGEMEYLKQREAKLRDTNESTNERVKGFAVLGMVTLLASGVWQVWYLRSFFQRKKLI